MTDSDTLENRNKPWLDYNTEKHPWIVPGVDRIYAKFSKQLGKPLVGKSSKISDFKRTLAQLVLNLQTCHHYTRWHGLAVGVHHETAPETHSYYYLHRMITVLEMLGYVVKERGRVGKLTVVAPLPRFGKLCSNYCPQHYDPQLHKPVEMYTRKNDESSRRRIRYAEKDYAETFEILEKWNNEVRNRTIELDGRDVVDVFLQRKFVKSKTIKTKQNEGTRKHGFGGGRIYAIPLNLPEHFMNVQSKRRLEILLDGEEVAEIDYKTLHPRMMYSNYGKELPEGDPYVIEGFEREVGKKTLNILVNSRSRESAIRAVRRELPGIDAKLAVEEVLQKHHAIANMLHSDKGIVMQLIDSDIMLQILKRCLEHDLIVLPVHDSVVCPQSQVDFIAAVMMEEYRRRTGGWECPVSVEMLGRGKFIWEPQKNGAISAISA